VITAAIDARRLGYLTALPASLLQAMAVAYLNGPQLASAPSTWFTSALTYACEPVNGAISPLAPTSAVIGHIDGYLLADYLDQHGRTARRSEAVPDSVWTSLTTHTPVAADLSRLGSSAAARGRYEHACNLWTAACNKGDMGRAMSLRNILNRAGHHTEANRILWQAAAAGDPEGLTLLSGFLRHDQRDQELEQLLRDAAEPGHHQAAHDLAVFLYRTGRGSEAEQILRRAIAAGDQRGWRLLAVLLDRMGRHNRAEEVLRQAAAGNSNAPRSPLASRPSYHEDQAERLQRTGAPDGKIGVAPRYGPAATPDARDPTPPPREETLMARGKAEPSGRPSGRRVWPPANPGDRNRGYRSRQISDNYNPSPGFLAAWKRSQARTEQYLRDQIDSGNASFARELAVLLVQANRIDEGEQMLRSAVVAGDAHAISLLTRVVLNTGRTREASLLQKYGLAANGSTAHAW